MASKTIMIQDETYQKLAELKKESESFNDVIQRLIYKFQNLDPYYGLLADRDGDLVEDAIEKARAANDIADLSRGDSS